MILRILICYFILTCLCLPSGVHPTRVGQDTTNNDTSGTNSPKHSAQSNASYGNQDLDLNSHTVDRDNGGVRQRSRSQERSQGCVSTRSELETGQDLRNRNAEENHATMQRDPSNLNVRGDRRRGIHAICQSLQMRHKRKPERRNITSYNSSKGFDDDKAGLRQSAARNDSLDHSTSQNTGHSIVNEDMKVNETEVMRPPTTGSFNQESGQIRAHSVQIADSEQNCSGQSKPIANDRHYEAPSGNEYVGGVVKRRKTSHLCGSGLSLPPKGTATVDGACSSSESTNYISQSRQQDTQQHRGSSRYQAPMQADRHQELEFSKPVAGLRKVGSNGRPLSMQKSALSPLQPGSLPFRPTQPMNNQVTNTPLEMCHSESRQVAGMCQMCKIATLVRGVVAYGLAALLCINCEHIFQALRSNNEAQSEVRNRQALLNPMSNPSRQMATATMAQPRLPMPFYGNNATAESPTILPASADTGSLNRIQPVPYIRGLSLDPVCVNCGTSNSAKWGRDPFGHAICHSCDSGRRLYNYSQDLREDVRARSRLMYEQPMPNNEGNSGPVHSAIYQHLSSQGNHNSILSSFLGHNQGDIRNGQSSSGHQALQEDKNTSDTRHKQRGLAKAKSSPNRQMSGNVHTRNEKSSGAPLASTVVTQQQGVATAKSSVISRLLAIVRQIGVAKTASSPNCRLSAHGQNRTEIINEAPSAPTVVTQQHETSSPNCRLSAIDQQPTEKIKGAQSTPTVVTNQLVDVSRNIGPFGAPNNDSEDMDTDSYHIYGFLHILIVNALLSPNMIIPENCPLQNIPSLDDINEIFRGHLNAVNSEILTTLNSAERDAALANRDLTVSMWLLIHGEYRRIVSKR